MNKNEMTLQQKALAASFLLHEQMLNDCCYAGYEGNKEDFDRLYDEVLVIARDEFPVYKTDITVGEVVEMFHEYQLEQMDGVRDIGWYL